MSPPIAAMELVSAYGSLRAARAAVEHTAQRCAVPPDVVTTLRDLLAHGTEGCVRVAEEARRAAEQGSRRVREGASPEKTLAAQRRFFDRCVGLSEEASVALYSLGSPALLEALTQEIVEHFAASGWLGKEKSVLQIGCGIGRMEAALAPHVAQAHGVDLSPKMVETARRRCADLPNVRFVIGSGRDLAGFSDERFALVYAVDSFPYVVAAGPRIADALVRESARVLVPGGDLVLVNFSYRGDAEADCRDVEALGQAHGLEVRVRGAQPFALWDGRVFHLQKRTNRRG